MVGDKDKGWDNMERLCFDTSGQGDEWEEKK